LFFLKIAQSLEHHDWIAKKSAIASWRFFTFRVS